MAALNILGIGGDEQPGSLLGIPGATVLDISPPNADRPVEQRDALASLYNGVTGMIRSDRYRPPGLLPPIWNPDNPVGTERVREQSAYTADPGFRPGAMWGGNMVSQDFRDRVDLGNTIAGGFVGSAGPGPSNTNLLGFRAYHGSPHDFPPTPRNPHGEFDATKIGTGEGAQAYGVGAAYLAEREGVARGYRDALTAQHRVPVTDPASGRVYKPGDPYYEDAVKMYGSPGHMYEVQVNAAPEHFLHWDKPLSEQSPQVQKALKGLEGLHPSMSGETTGQTIISNLENYHGSGVDASQALREAGIPGIRYLDQGSRHAPKLSDAETQQLQAAIADKQRLIADPRQQRDIDMHQADLDLFQRRLKEADDISHNVVVFDAATMEILRKYGLAGLMLGGGAAAGAQGSKTQ